MEMLDKVTWPVVVLVGVVMGAIVALALSHVDASIILNAVALLGLGGVLASVSSVKSNVNGNLTKLADGLNSNMGQLTVLLSSAMEKLAQSGPIAPTDPPKEDAHV